MKYEKGSRGLKGITLQQRWVKKWGYSLHVSTETLKRKFTVHKEEKPGHVKKDCGDCKKLCAKLKRCIDPFDTKSYPTELINI